MKRSKGQRQGTRSILRRGRHQRGRVNISRIMHDYAEGDRVAIVLDGGQQMGMPHRRFQGRTGFIQGRQGKAWVVSVKDGNMQKTVVARPEHLKSTNPTRVLERGYSMAVDEKGVPVTSVAGLKQGDPLTVVLKDGQVETEVR